MRRILTIVLSLMLLASTMSARVYEVSGPQGGLSLKVSLPKGFNPATDSCHMVILMHGIFSSKDFLPMPQIAKALAKEGIASIRFDFDGHGKSEGQMIDMTIANELADAKAIYSNSSMHIVEGENHLIIKKQKEVIRIILDFLEDTLKQPCTK